MSINLIALPERAVTFLRKYRYDTFKHPCIVLDQSKFPRWHFNPEYADDRHHDAVRESLAQTFNE